MATKSFTDQVQEWADKTKSNLEWVFRESASRVIREMQRVGPSVAHPGGGDGGHLPVDLGFLRASLIATLNAPATGVKVNNGDVHVSYSEGPTQLIILGAKLGDSIFAVYTAAYARRMEYGFVGNDSLGREYHQSGYGFVRLAVQQWPHIVQAVVAEAQKRKAT